MKISTIKSFALILITWMVVWGQTGENKMLNKTTVKKVLNLAIAEEIAAAAEPEK